MADFQDIKRRFPIEKTAELLGLTLKPASGGLRGPCPACERGGERALAITPVNAGEKMHRRAGVKMHQGRMGGIGSTAAA